MLLNFFICICRFPLQCIYLKVVSFFLMQWAINLHFNSKKIWRNVALIHLLTNRSSAVNGCRQNESPNSWLNITIIHTTPVHQLMSCEVKICVFVSNKSIIKKCLTSHFYFLLKYEPITPTNASSSEKVHHLLSSHIKIYPHNCSDLFWTVLPCAYFPPYSSEMTFPLEKVILSTWAHSVYVPGCTF